MQLILAFSKLVWIRSIKMKSKELFKSHQGTLSIIKHRNKSIGKLSRKLEGIYLNLETLNQTKIYGIRLKIKLKR